MKEFLLISITGILLLGILAQWLAWRLNIPSILTLLIIGFLVGPIFGVVSPDEILGELLFPIISLSVAIILYEGGLSLKLSEFERVGKVVRNLIFIGIFVTWILATLAGYYILGLSFSIATLFGSILTVTGPTVIIPLMRLVRPKGKLNSILKWEGIMNDPVGALLAVLVFEAIVIGGLQHVPFLIFTGFLKTVILGGGLGFLGAYLLVLLIKSRMLPEFLQNPVSLTLVITVFAASNMMQMESGLFAVTIMGVVLANQKKVEVHHIIEFKENLRILLISVLFIVLAARLQIGDLHSLGWTSGLFLAFLIIVVRPAVAVLSTIGSGLSWQERLFLSWMAPRGIVAAAVASLFALELSKAGIAEGEKLVPLTFLVIVGTITVYGLSAMPLAKRLNITDANPQGCLIAGAHPFARAVAASLKKHGIRALLVDTNWENISEARMLGLQTYHGSIISEHILNEIDLTGIGRLLALTPNPEVNSLATLHFEKIFGGDEVYQLAVIGHNDKMLGAVSQELRGHCLFGNEATFANILQLLGDQQELKSTKLTPEFNFQSFKDEYKNQEFIPMFIVDENKRLLILSHDTEFSPKANQTVISLVGEVHVRLESES